MGLIYCIGLEHVRNGSFAINIYTGSMPTRQVRSLLEHEDDGYGNQNAALMPLI